MEHLLNIKSNWKHSTMEYLIKNYDTSQNMSRSAVFERAVRAAAGVKDWDAIRLSLVDLREQKDAPIFTSFQAKYDDATAQLLDTVRTEMLQQLQTAGVLKVLQTQFMVLLLQANYLQKLKEQRLALKANRMVEEADVSLPDIARLLCEMMLQDPGCSELETIRGILVSWKSKTHIYK